VCVCVCRSLKALLGSIIALCACVSVGLSRLCWVLSLPVCACESVGLSRLCSVTGSSDHLTPLKWPASMNLFSDRSLTPLVTLSRYLLIDSVRWKLRTFLILKLTDDGTVCLTTAQCD